LPQFNLASFENAGDEVGHLPAGELKHVAVMKLQSVIFKLLLMKAPEESVGFMSNVVLPCRDEQSTKHLQEALDRRHKVYIVTGRVAGSMSAHGSDVFFTRLSAQVYLQMEDFEKLADLVPRILAEYSVTAAAQSEHRE
jgi:selenocysteine lyase/cysteine desulfurase